MQFRHILHPNTSNTSPPRVAVTWQFTWKEEEGKRVAIVSRPRGFEPVVDSEYGFGPGIFYTSPGVVVTWKIRSDTAPWQLSKATFPKYITPPPRALTTSWGERFAGFPFRVRATHLPCGAGNGRGGNAGNGHITIGRRWVCTAGCGGTGISAMRIRTNFSDSRVRDFADSNQIFRFAGSRFRGFRGLRICRFVEWGIHLP